MIDLFMGFLLLSLGFVLFLMVAVLTYLAVQLLEIQCFGPILHKWKAWENVKMTFGPSKVEYSAQRRFCSLCNKKQIREC